MRTQHIDTSSLSKLFRVTSLLLFVFMFGCNEPIETENTVKEHAVKETKDRLPEYIEDIIQDRIKKKVYPSIAIGIVDENGSRFYSYGETSKNGKAVDEHSIYEIGSISKVFTAILLAQQSLDGDLKLDDKINDYLPEKVKVPVMGEQEITFGNLSDHTSGLPRMPDNFAPANPNNPYADYTVDLMYDFISSYKPIREVGEEYEYSNLAQGLLGHILAQNKGISYEELMIDIIATPLGMEETKIAFDKNMKANLAIGHSKGKEVENWDIPTLAGAGGIRSSTSDMLKFLSANIGLTDTSLQESMNLTHQVRHDKTGWGRVGLGWIIQVGASGDIIWHNGGTGGYRTFAGFVKETKKGVVVLSNSNASPDDIGLHLLDSTEYLSPITLASIKPLVTKATIQKYIGQYKADKDDHETQLIYIVMGDDNLIGADFSKTPQEELFPIDTTNFIVGNTRNLAVRFDAANGKLVVQGSSGSMVWTFSKTENPEEKEYLNRINSKYRLSGATWRFNYENGILTVDIPYDGFYILMPKSEKEFIFPGWPGYGLRFITNDSNTKIIHIEYIQPNRVDRLHRF